MASYCPQIRPIDWDESEVDLDWRRAEKPRSGELRKLALMDEAIMKALLGAETHVRLGELAIGQRFREQADKWERETRHLSSPTQKVMHPSYQAILGMGYDVVPFMLRDLTQNRREWFWALSYITQVNPIKREDAGKMDKMIKAWVNWGKERGLI